MTLNALYTCYFIQWQKKHLALTMKRQYQVKRNKFFFWKNRDWDATVMHSYNLWCPVKGERAESWNPGFPWIPIDSHGFQRLSQIPRIPMDSHGFLWLLSNSSRFSAFFWYIRLTREPPQLIRSVWAHILLIGRAHSVDKNPRRIRAIAAFIPSYSCFTELLAYDKVCTDKSNEDISTWNFVHK